MIRLFPAQLVTRLRGLPLGILLVTSLAGCPYISPETHDDNTDDDDSDVVVDPDTDIIDPDTDTTSGIDMDGDGFDADVDCDDSNATVNPGAEELCDGLDTDCDGDIDEGFPDLYLDLDRDGYGSEPTDICNTTDPTSELSGDCDDTKSEVYPNNPEVCDTLDNDCNDAIDDGLLVRYRDADDDGIGAGAPLACDAPGSWSLETGDCNDNNASMFPGNLEICDEIDNDCNPATEESGVATLFPGNGSAPTNLDTENPNVTLIVNRPGQAELRFCDGSFDMTFQFQNNAQPLLMSGLGVVKLLPVDGSERVVYVEDTDLELNNLSILGGSFDGAGGGMFCINASVTLNAVSFDGNTAWFGGALYADSCAMTGDQVSFSNNAGTSIGGSVVHAVNGSTLTWSNASWLGNTGDLALVLGDSDVFLSNSLMADSTDDGIYLTGDSLMSLSNVNFNGNNGWDVLFENGFGMNLGSRSSATCTSPGNSCVAR